MGEGTPSHVAAARNQEVSKDPVLQGSILSSAGCMGKCIWGVGRAGSSHSNAQAAFPGRQAGDREEGRDRRGTGRTQEEEADENGG